MNNLKKTFELNKYILLFSIFFVPSFHLAGVIYTGRWAGERKERISEVTL